MILVTGGTGFLGSKLIELLIAEGITIRAIKRITSIIPQFLQNHPLIEWVDLDFSNYFEVQAALQDIRQVYHCAATVSYSRRDLALMKKTNVENTGQLVNLCLDLGIRLLHVSSVAAIGNSKNGEFINENHFWEYDRNLSSYSVSKYESEMEIWRGIEEGLDAVIVNPGLIIGPSAGNKGSGSIFHTLAKGLSFYTAGTTGVVDVEDVAASMILLMNRKDIRGERFIITNVNISHKELLQTTSQYLGIKRPDKEAKFWMLNLVRLLLNIKTFFTGKPHILTKDSVRVSLKKLQFSNQKFVKKTGFVFKPLDQTLQAIALQINSINKRG